jgi:membrane protease YdiL (CAAX protease family)
MSPAIRLGVAAIVAEVGMMIPVVLVFIFGRLDLDLSLGLARPKFAQTTWSLVAMFGGGIVLDHLMHLGVRALPGLRSPELVAMGESAASATVVEALVLLLPLALLPSICEEVLCRGVILRGLMIRWKRPRMAWLPILLSSLFFGLLHLDPLHASAAMLMGLLLGFIAVRTGSIWPCVICHLANNAISIMTPNLGGPNLVQVLDHGRSLPTVSIGAALLCAGLVGLTFTTSGDRSVASQRDEKHDASNADDSEEQ